MGVVQLQLTEGIAWVPAQAVSSPCVCFAPAARQRPCHRRFSAPADAHAVAPTLRGRRAALAQRGAACCAQQTSGSGVLQLEADRMTVEVGGRQVLYLGTSAGRVTCCAALSRAVSLLADCLRAVIRELLRCSLLASRS